MDPTIYKAIASGNVAQLERRISLDLLCHSITYHKNTALHVAVQFNNMECVRTIYNKCPELLTQRNSSGDTVLHMAARVGLYNMADFLIKQSPNHELIRMTNGEKDTALHEAVRNRRYHLVKLLTLADPTFESFLANNAGETPLYLATEAGNLDVVQQILQICPNSAYGGPDGRTALHVAILLGHTDVAKLLIKMQPGLITKADDKGWTPLHCAATFTSSDSASIIEDITECSPDSWELVDKNGRNFLHLAVSCSNKQVVKHILQTYKMIEGLVNQQDNDGNTPLHLASILDKRPSNITDFFVDDVGRHIMKYLCSDERVNIRVVNKENLTAQDISLKVFGLVPVESPHLNNPRSETLKKEMVEVKNVVKGKAGENIVKDSQRGRGVISSDRAQLNIVVATLVFTVAFAACFQIPGGYRTEDGEVNGKGVKAGAALLKEQGDFKLFVMCNDVAMMMSALIIFGHLYMSTLDEAAEWLKAFMLTSSFTGTTIAVIVLICGYVSAMSAVDLVSPIKFAAEISIFYAVLILAVIIHRFGLKGTLNIMRRYSIIEKRENQVQ